MDAILPNFIQAEKFCSITGMQISDAIGMRFFIYHKGWVEACKFNNDSAKAKIYVDGYFPANLLLYNNEMKQVGAYEYIDVEYYSFCASFSKEFATIGLSTHKKELLSLTENDNLESIFFAHDVFKSIDNHYAMASVFILESDLFDFCEKEGIFDARERYQSLIQTLTFCEDLEGIPETHEAPQSTTPSISFHPNTSQALLDLIEANDEFWTDYDCDNPNTAPKKSLVTRWLQDKGYNPTLASYMDTVLREGRNQKGGFT
jgi:hypothetical protein